MQADQIQQPTPISDPLTLRKLTEVLIKYYGLHEGSYDLLIEFQIGVSGVAHQPDPTPLPTAMVSVSKLGLTKSLVKTNSSVDAALVNPKKKKKQPSKKEE